MKLINLVLALLMLSSCATFSQKDVAEIKKVAVVSGIQDSLFLYGSGLTAFEGSSNQADISSWDLTNRISKQVAAAGKAQHPEIEFSVMDRTKYPYKPDYGSIAKIAEQMKNEGYDTLLLITNAGVYSSNTGTQIVESRKAGFILWEKALFGNSLATFICAQYRLDLIKTADNRLFKTASTADIYGQPTFALPAKPFNQYTPDEIETIKKALLAHIDTTTTKNTIQVFTPSPSP